MDSAMGLKARLQADQLKGLYGKATRTQITLTTHTYSRLQDALAMVNQDLPETAQAGIEDLLGNIIDKALQDLGV